MNQLQRDLQRRIDDRLQLWLKDSLVLYKIADLEFTECIMDIVLVLAGKLCQLTTEIDFKPNQIAKLVYDAAVIIQREARAHDEEESRK